MLNAETRAALAHAINIVAMASDIASGEVRRNINAALQRLLDGSDGEKGGKAGSLPMGASAAETADPLPPDTPAKIAAEMRDYITSPVMLPRSGTLERWAARVEALGLEHKKEMHDFRFVLEQVPKVYMAVTRDRMSKANYYARDVIAEYESCLQDDIDQAIKEEREALGLQPSERVKVAAIKGNLETLLGDVSNGTHHQCRSCELSLKVAIAALAPIAERAEEVVDEQRTSRHTR